MAGGRGGSFWGNVDDSSYWEMVCACWFKVGVRVTLCEGQKKISTAKDIIRTGIVSGVEHFDSWYTHW